MFCASGLRGVAFTPGAEYYPAARRFDLTNGSTLAECGVVLNVLVKAVRFAFKEADDSHINAALEATARLK